MIALYLATGALLGGLAVGLAARRKVRWAKLKLAGMTRAYWLAHEDWMLAFDELRSARAELSRLHSPRDERGRFRKRGA